MAKQYITAAIAAFLFMITMQLPVNARADAGDVTREGSAHLKPCPNPACGISDNKQPAVFLCDAEGRPLWATVTCTHCGTVGEYQVRSNIGGGGLVNVQLVMEDLIMFTTPGENPPDILETPEPYEPYEPPSPITSEPPAAPQIIPDWIDSPGVYTNPRPLPDGEDEAAEPEGIGFGTEGSPMTGNPANPLPVHPPFIEIEPIGDTLDFEVVPMPTTGARGKELGAFLAVLGLAGAAACWSASGKLRHL